MAKKKDTVAAKTSGTGRREFLRNAAAGVAGVAAVATLGANLGTAKAEAPKPGATAGKLTAAEQVKEDKRAKAEAILKEIDDVEIKWVKAKTPSVRKVIQLNG